jgi:hypothetical protein
MTLIFGLGLLFVALWCICALAVDSIWGGLGAALITAVILAMILLGITLVIAGLS